MSRYGAPYRFLSFTKISKKYFSQNYDKNAILLYNVSMKIFSERLTELRKERGLSQAAVAKALGVSLGIVCYWETNKSDPTATNVAKIARYFHVSADFLLGLDET